MEDHKRKNKKKNQNKRPTQEQIKKIQNNVEQRKEKIESTHEELANNTSLVKNGVINGEDIKNKNHVTEETNGKDKKSKKKNKQKGKHKENECPTANGQTGGVDSEQIQTESEPHKAGIGKETPANISSSAIPKVNSDTLAAAIDKVTVNSETPSCLQYHEDEAPDCSHHIQHHKNTINMGDMKIDFDVQKHLSPMVSKSGSNQEYFYKGFNVEKLEAVSTGVAVEIKKHEVFSKVPAGKVPSMISEMTGTDKSNPISYQNSLAATSIEPNTTPGRPNEFPKNVTLPLVPNERLKNKTGQVGGSEGGASCNSHEILQTMLAGAGNLGGPSVNLEEICNGIPDLEENLGAKRFKPQDVLKQMFGTGSDHANLPSANPNEMLKNMLINVKSQKTFPLDSEGKLKTMPDSPENLESKELNPQNMLKNMFGTGLTQGTLPPINPNEMMKNMFQKCGNQETSPFNPIEMMKNMMQEMRSMQAPRPNLNNIHLPNMIGQMNAMVQNMDPSFMSSMGQIVASMDPAVLSGMNSMVANMMQSTELPDIMQNAMQVEAGLEKNTANTMEYENSEETLKTLKVDGKTYRNNLSEKENEAEKDNTEPTIFFNEAKKEDLPSTKIETEDIPLTEKIERVDSEEKVETGMKCNFSFSSNASEISDENSKENESTKPSECSEDEFQLEPRKPLRFVRDESIPELLENLIKADVKKEVKTDCVEIKRNKIKTIFSRVLKKKTIEGGNTSTIQLQEHCVKYQIKNKPSKSNDSSKKEIDYEKLQHVKEPMEVRRHNDSSLDIKSKVQMSKTKDNQNKTVKAETKLDETGEINNQNMTLPDICKGSISEDSIEFNPESMNEFFTNLLQGRETKIEKTGIDVAGDKNEFMGKDHVANLLQNSGIKKLQNKDNATVSKGVNADSLIGDPTSAAAPINLPISMMMPENMANIFGTLQQNSKNGVSNPQEDPMANHPSSFENAMNQMFNSLLSTCSDINQKFTEIPGQSGISNDFLQNFQQSMLQKMTQKSENDVGGPSGGNLLESMSEMFDKMFSEKDVASFPDMNTLIGDQENLTNILKMGEMMFGNSPFGVTSNVDKLNESSRNSVLENCEGEASIIDVSETETESNEDDTERCHVSKNIYQEERPSVLLKQLLGDKFWSIRKKRDKIVRKENSISKSELKKRKKEDYNKSSQAKTSETSNAKGVGSESSTRSEALPPELKMALENESPLVRMLHKKIQKDTKLQQFLKEKLQKDPKMQKFIQEKLQKDERIQKFIREKLSKDKNLRQSFEEKFKTELGLTNIIPKFDDDEQDDCSNAGKPIDNQEDEEKKTPNILSAEPSEADNLIMREDTSIDTIPPKNTKLLFKKYVELTFLLCTIVYMGILCY